MNALLLLLLVFCIKANMPSSLESSYESSASDEKFEEELEEGYQLLKGELNADDTKNLLEQLHKMEPEIKQELALSPERENELREEMKNYVQTEDDHVQLMGDTVEEINAYTRVDRALFQGDMLLTKEQAVEVIEDVKENEAKRNKRQAYRDRRFPISLWPKAVNYYFYNASYEARRVFINAALIWQNLTCINFYENPYADDKIMVVHGAGCWSNVGRVGGRQNLSLGNRCDSVPTAAHEIGHALGFFHTQSRHDRDDFITLYLQNFLNGWISQFTKQTEHTNYNYNLTYDYGSIMHYGANSVSRNDQPVMVPRDLKYTQTLGSPFISFYEKLMMNLHYSCLDKCNGTYAAKCENGGFPHPRNCYECICPSGYGGRLCNERPSGCGQTLVATPDYQWLEDTVGEKGVRHENDDFLECNYWIQGPNGSTIEVMLEEYSGGVSMDGCRYGGVEIKTGSDKRHTGYRFCSPKLTGTTLVSHHSMVPIITYAKGRRPKTVLRYRLESAFGKKFTTPKFAKTTPRPTTQPTRRPRCTDSGLCVRLRRMNFCNDSRYNKTVKKQVCPRLCGFCW